MRYVGLEFACGCSKHRLIYKRALLLRHASEELLPLPVALLCCLCGLVPPEVFLQIHKSILNLIRSNVMFQEACRTLSLISSEV